MNEVLPYHTAPQLADRTQEFFIKLAEANPGLVTPRLMLKLLESPIGDGEQIIYLDKDRLASAKFQQLLKEAADEQPDARYRTHISAAGAKTRKTAKRIAAATAAVLTGAVALHVSLNRLEGAQLQKLQGISNLVRDNGGDVNQLPPEALKQHRALLDSANTYQTIMDVEDPLITIGYLGSGLAAAVAILIWFAGQFIQPETAKERLDKLASDPKAGDAFMDLVLQIEPILQGELAKQRQEQTR